MQLLFAAIMIKIHTQRAFLLAHVCIYINPKPLHRAYIAGVDSSLGVRVRGSASLGVCAAQDDQHARGTCAALQ
jgi:hypothetical protein